MMKRISPILGIVTLSIVIASSSRAQTTMFGGRGMFRVFSAETVQSGALYLNTFFVSFLNSGGGSGLGKDHTWNFGLTYGLLNNLELTAQIVPYQDDQEHIWGPPGDTQVGLKLRLPLSTSGVTTGLRGFLSIPTAQNHNVPFEPYSSDQLAWGVMGLITINLTNTFPLFPLKFHTNVGYVDHNIQTIFSNEVTDQLLLGFGFKFPIQSFILYTEYTGEIFFNHDAVSFRDNSMRLTQGFKFIGPLNVIVDLGLEIGLSRDLDVYPAPLHEYADWKIMGGLTYQFSAGKVYEKNPRVAKKNRKEEERGLEKIKKKREKAGEDLENLREKLEKETKEKPQ
ncbi:MAG: hypothetical protein ACE5IW_10590 [bacterium]